MNLKNFWHRHILPFFKKARSPQDKLPGSGYYYFDLKAGRNFDVSVDANNSIVLKPTLNNKHLTLTLTCSSPEAVLDKAKLHYIFHKICRVKTPQEQSQYYTNFFSIYDKPESKIKLEKDDANFQLRAITIKFVGESFKAPEDSSYLFAFGYELVEPEPLNKDGSVDKSQPYTPTLVKGFPVLRPKYETFLELTNLEKLDISNVSNMAYMFDHTQIVNSNTECIEQWDVSKVINMSYMFSYSNLTPTLANWDTKFVFNMSHMFAYNININPTVDNWDVSAVTNMSSMFEHAESANPNVANWDVSSVINMSHMFDQAEVANPQVENWDVSNVIDMSYLFANTKQAQPNVLMWDVSSVTNMERMFFNARLANPQVAYWDVSAVTNMDQIFSQAPYATPYIANWVLNADLDKSKLPPDFVQLQKLGLTNKDIKELANPTLEKHIFKSLITDANFAEEPEQVISLKIARQAHDINLILMASSPTATLNKFKLHQFVNTTLRTMFADYVYNNVLFNFVFENAMRLPEDSSYLFAFKYVISANSQTELAEDQRIQYTVENCDYLDTSKVTNMAHMFDGATLADPEVDTWDTSAVTNMSGLFLNASMAEPDVSNWQVSAVTDMSYMFAGTEKANPDVSKWNVQKVTNMAHMFASTSAANPSVDKWLVKKVEDMSYMFYKAKVAKPVVGYWKLQNITDLAYMFAYSPANPDVSYWDVSKVTNMSGMFAYTENAQPEVNIWKVDQVTDMSHMFDHAVQAQPQVSSWNVSKVTNMASMFAFTEQADPDVSAWDVSQVTDMSGMFESALQAQTDTSNWQVTKVTNLARMFFNAPLAKPQVSTWDVSKVTDFTHIFTNAKSSNTDIKSWQISPSAKLDSHLKCQLMLGISTAQLNLIKDVKGDVDAFIQEVQDFNLASDRKGTITFSLEQDVKTNSLIVVIKPQSDKAELSKFKLHQLIKQILTKVVTPNRIAAIKFTSKLVAPVNASYLFAFNYKVDNLGQKPEFNKDFVNDLQIIGCEYLDVSETTDMKHMFEYAISANPNVANWDTGNVTNMEAMFAYTNNANPDVTNWNLRNVSNISKMFAYSKAANPNVTNWNTKNVKKSADIFSHAESITNQRDILATW